MKTTQHTAGEWTPDAATHRGATYIQQVNPEANGGWVIATCWGPDREANACLIAAAPELLANLEQLLNCAVWAKQTIGDVSEKSHFVESIRESRAAIAKARGE